MGAQMQPLDVTQLDFSGGQVDGQHPTQLEANQSEFCTNLYGVGSKLRGRPGLKKVSTTGAYSINLNQLLSYRPASGNWTKLTSNLMLGTAQGFAYLNGTAVSTITTGLASNSEPWHMRQYKDVVYAVRAEATLAASVLHRVTLTGEMTAGIAAPATAMSAAEGAAGVLAAGTYTYVVVYENSTTGAVSNPSPSVAVTIAASKKVDLSSIPVSGNAQVDRKKIYRSLIGQSGVYYFVANITNATTTYTDNISPDALGDAANYDNAEPPTGLIALESWNERLWAIDEKNVYYSRILYPESWKATNLIPVDPDDEQINRAIIADGKGKRLLLGKSGSIHEITGVANSNFRVDLVSKKHGVAGPHAMATAEGMVFFFSGENVYGIEPGGRDPQSISSVAIRKIIDAIPDAQIRKVRLSTFAPYSWLIMLCAVESSTTHQKMCIYNYKTGAWYVFTFASFGSDAPCCVAEANDSNFKPVLYALVDSASYRYVYQFTDDVYTDGAAATDGAAIAIRYRSRALAAEGRLVCMNRVGIMARFVRNDPDPPTPPDISAYGITVTPYVDGVVYGSGKAMKIIAPTNASREAAAAAAQWRQTNLSTNQKPGTFVQVQVACSETANRLEIAGLNINGGVMARRRKVA